jgi:hypothetical protein
MTDPQIPDPENTIKVVFEDEEIVILYAEGQEDTIVRPRRPEIPREWPPVPRPSQAKEKETT